VDCGIFHRELLRADVLRRDEMNLHKRRDFLKLCIGSAPGWVLARRLNAGAGSLQETVPGSIRKPRSVDRYIDPLPIPKILKPESVSSEGPLYRVGMSEFAHTLHSQLPPTRVWGYAGQFPGPTIEAERGKPLVIAWENHLPVQHLFAIDPRIQGAAPPTAAVRTAPCVHGGRVPEESNGLPERWLVPGQTIRARYPNNQSAAALWYHDRAAGISRLNVYAGLSGLYLLLDEEERKAANPASDYEIPLILRDCTLDDHGQLVYATTFDDGQMPPPGTWAPECLGELPLINGALYPYLEVEPRAYRFRVVNAANQRFFELFLNLAKDPIQVPSLVNFQQIGGDGGLLPSRVALHKLLLAPGERADLLVDFSGYAGKTVTLSNGAAAPFPSWDVVHPHHAALYELMQFRVTLARKDVSAAPSRPDVSNFPAMTAGPATATRDFILAEEMDRSGRSLGVRINGKGYRDPATESVRLGSTERWRFINDTEYAHPMHVDLAQFHVIERQGYSVVALRNGSIEPVGTARPAPANERGWKDTAVVNPREILTLLVRFEGYPGRYVFGSQILEQADKSLMRPYECLPA
jgi:spore coat protein A